MDILNINMAEHGGRTDDDNGGMNMIDFSANVSPFGTPDGVRQALENAARDAHIYPDPSCRRLRGAISDAYGIPAEWILCGNGASDLIWRIALASSRKSFYRGRAALIVAPTFSEYENALKACGRVNIKRYNLNLDADFYIRSDFLNWITGDVDLIFLCQPNNPTGMPVRMDLARRILNRCRETGTRLIWDECFLDFMDSPENYTLLDALSSEPNLIILRAFTKFYGMAGARLGYALCSDENYLNNLIGPPWSVSRLAQEAGIAALRDLNYTRNLRDYISRERSRLYRGLKLLNFRVIPGTANFLLFQSPVYLDQFLYQNGIFIRNCGNFKNLNAFWYRIAVRTEQENNRLLDALREAVGTLAENRI